MKLVLAVALLACGAPDAPRPPPPAPIVSETPLEAPRASCLSAVAPSEQPLTRVVQSTTIGDRTFAVAWRGMPDPEQVIVSLDARGELSITPIPIPYADPFTIGSDPGGLVIVSVALHGTGSLLRVALGADGALTPGTLTPIPEVAWGWPESIVSDGERLILFHNVANVDQTVGGRARYTIDLRSARVLTTAQQVPQESCGPGGCVRYDDHEIVLRDGDREERLAITSQSTCPAWYSFEHDGALLYVSPGDRWRAARVANGHLREVAIADTLAAAPGCGNALYPFPGGVMNGTQRDRELLRYDGRVFGVSEALPPTAYLQTVRAEHADGVIEVGWSGGSGMMHSPSDREIRRYFEHWHFDGGEVTLLRREHDRWRVAESARLPLENAEGTFHDGYTPFVLRNGLYASVLLAPAGGSEPAYLMPFLAPCEALSVSRSSLRSAGACW